MIESPTAVPESAVAQWRATAAARPDHLAVVTPDGSITYGAARAFADERAGAVAAAVSEPGQPVAIDIESDVESVLAVLAVLSSGHPVILLDPLLPDDRRDHILALSGATRLSPSQIAELPRVQATVAEPEPGDAAVMIFTSGSTGKPKGLVHSQRGWVNQARDGHEFMGLDDSDRAAVLLPLSFGAGFDCLVMSLLNGATMLLWDSRRRSTTGLLDWLAAEGASTVHCTPSLLRAWLPELSPGEQLPDVRLLSTCGEPIHSTDIEHLRRTLLSDAVYCSWSGSSEMGNLAFNSFPPERALPTGVIPVGTPATDKLVRIVDDTGTDVPVGETGEVHVESGHMALRYHGDPEMTATKFVPLGDGRFRLRTGDLGRFDESGQLHLLGRCDDAVKIRGYLVEPAEVEAALRSLPWTTEAVVTANREAGQLIAHVAIDEAGWTPSPAEIRTELAKTLAPWMIPRDVVVMTALPRNERGKVDRNALPPPAPRSPEPVRGPTEAALSHLWCEVLGLETAGRNEDFISLGGDSLAAAKMLSGLQERWLVDIPSSDFAREPTIAGLAATLDRAHRDRASTAGASSITELRSGEGRPLFLAAGAGSPAASLLPLTRSLNADLPVYGIQAHGLENRGRADRSIRAAARRAVRDIRSIQPEGPYRLAGYSMGALVMLESATILRRSGQECEQVLLLDPLFEPELLARVTGEAASARSARHDDSGADRAALPDRGAGDDDAAARAGAEQSQIAVLWNRVMMRLLVSTAGLLRLPTTLQWTVFWDLGRELIKKHHPTPYSGPVHLICSRENPDDLGVWKRLATGVLEVSEVAGDHHSMMRAPAVAETAAAVDRALGNTGTRVEES
ncbi:AMP-binding protein [Williamsia sp.]|uniref:AMP-binding protein n=1 Tax=Williamsia sp. TaxID=1872085 RepID=UPI002F93189B